jgi:hypothetical protein
MTFYARKHRLPQRDEVYFCVACGASSKDRMMNLVKGDLLCDDCNAKIYGDSR